jgi:hypothetical protein
MPAIHEIVRGRREKNRERCAIGRTISTYSRLFPIRDMAECLLK